MLRKGFGGKRAFDDFERPPAVALERVFEFAACIATIGEDMPQPGDPVADGFEDVGRAIAIVDAGGMDEDED